MTTFEVEYQILLRDYHEKTKDLDELYPWEGGLDGKAEEERRKYAAEYRQQLRQLRINYGREVGELIPAQSQAN